MPQRLLRPGIRQSKRWNRIGYFEQTLYVRLITLVDDYGRYEADPELIRSEAFPYGDPNGEPIPVPTIDSGLLSIASKCLLTLYEHDGKQYLQLTRWKERARSESRFPSPKNDGLLTNDSKCQQMMAPTPSPKPSPKPSPSPRADMRVELPVGFPKTEKEALEQTSLLGAHRDFVLKTWNLAVSRGGDDSKGVRIRSFQHYVKTQMNYDEDRKRKGSAEANDRPHAMPMGNL